ncbi:MAG: dTDP-glucose 4,6-dehydratase [Elusimicrobia bacterium]|nr:dTDP-glucose 4,6-dehydratase [Elusimicrobiota bacterium]
MRLLVTGGLGFIGSNFVRHVLKSHPSWTVVNIDVLTYAGNPANLADLARNPRYRWVRGDIRDPRAVAGCMEGADAVVHFAAESHVDRSILDASSFIETNVLGTNVLLDAARRLSVGRFVHVSTDEVYGSVEQGFSTEDDPLAPNSPYAASKAASDLLVRSYVVTHGLPAVITRASNNFGPYQYPEKALPLLITNFMDDLPFPLYGDGLNVRDWVYVLDHVRAVEFVLLKGKTGEAYNVGGTHSCTNKELIERVRGLMGKPASLVTPVPDRPGHDRRYALDCRKLTSLGFKHAHPFEAALAKTIAWYRANPAWWRPLKKAGGYKKYYDKQYAGRLVGRRAGAPKR